MGLGLAMSLSQMAYARHLEANSVTVLDTTAGNFTSVTFLEPFDVLPIVVITPTNEGDDSATLRLRNVTTTGFEVTIVEPPGDDGPHEAMNTHYIAIEPGVTTMPNGTVFAAGFHSTDSFQQKGALGLTGQSWDTVNFGTTLTATASVVANIQTLNNEDNAIPSSVSEPFLSTAIRNVNTTTMQMTLDRVEVNTGTLTTDEVIGWIAFPQNTNGDLIATASQSISWDARTSPDNICLLYTSPSPRDQRGSRMPSSA